MNGEFQKLIQKRKKWVEANQENNFDEGIKRLLTDLYPDNAHFIYELLQNAEDAEATTVHFILKDDALEFKHDGQRLFSLKDVDSITSIGVSAKRDDPTSIGKFGVGFKAVFAYTKSPEIHSGEFHFRINDLVVPETEGIEDYNVGKKNTRFLFPFNNPNKPSYRARQEIERGLCEFGDNTLLFLSHIRTIKYALPNGHYGFVSRNDKENGLVEISNYFSPAGDSRSHWLYFEKNVEVEDEGNNPKCCRVAVAYKLAQEEFKKTGELICKIVPVDRGQVSIFFPAEKETSNLRFHLHAPFASTVARDSVRDSKANHRLRDKLAELVVESLANIRDQGKLTVGFLAVLPNPTDNLPTFYEPIRKAIVNAFKTDELTPTRSGTHAPADALYRGPARIAEVISDDDLSLLTNNKPPLWAANPPQQNQREDRFFDSLNIAPFGWSKLVSVINCDDIIIKDELVECAFDVSDDDDEYLTEDYKQRRLIESWVSEKDDAWLMRFYALLGEACDTHDECIYNTDELKIIRVTTEQGDKHVIAPEAFFPSDEGISPPSDISFVKPAVYAVGRSEPQKKYAKSFLENIGVRSFDAKASLELRLASYDNPPSRVDSRYYEDLNLFISYWKKNHVYWSGYSEELQLLKSKTILLGVSDKNELFWLKPEQLCLDSPYLETGLAELTKTHGKKPIWGGYQDRFKAVQLTDFLNFIRATGVMTGLSVEPSAIYKNIHRPELWKEHLNGVQERSTSIQEDYTTAISI